MTLAAPAAAEPESGSATSSPKGDSAPSATTTGPPADGATGSTTGEDPFAYDGSTPDAGTDAPLGSGDVTAQVQQAKDLAAQILEDDAEIATAVQELKTYSTAANKKLQEYAAARDEYTAAQDEAAAAGERLELLEKRLAAGRSDLRSWAFETYTQGGGYSDTMALLDTITRETHAAGGSASDLGYITDNRLRSVDLIREDTETQAELTKAKEEAEKKAASTKKKAARAKKASDDALAERTSHLDALRKKHADALHEAGPVVTALLGMADPQAQEATDALTAAMKEAGQDVSEFEGAKPCSDNEGSYPNGQIPPGGLCPLIGASGESLRPRAAAAFNAMSKAYAADTGAPLCVTDSYRSFAEQVVVKSQRGGWAAEPGKSNHGLGLAVDLCGGVNSFGHPAHLWMQQNAPAYGWFHPSWANAGGTLPEPWHWEFGG